MSKAKSKKPLLERVYLVTCHECIITVVVPRANQAAARAFLRSRALGEQWALNHRGRWVCPFCLDPKHTTNELRLGYYMF